MKNTIKIKSIFFFALIVVIMFSLTACRARELSSNLTAYYVVYTGTDKDKSRIEGIDVDGNPTVIHNIKAINITKSALIGEEFVAGGHRANNHLIIQPDGSFEEFYLLDNPQYSGVWSITLDDNNIISVMNGNVDVEKNIYVNLLVIQDRSQNILVKEEIGITPNILLIDNDYLYMGGCFWQYDTTPIYCGASIARYNIKTGEYEEQHFPYSENLSATEYMFLNQHGDYLYAVLNEDSMDKDSFENQNKIDVIDKSTFELIDTLAFEEKIGAIYFADEDLYIVIGDRLCKYNMLTRDIEELYSFPEDTSIEDSHIKDGHIYYSARYIPALKDGNIWNVGYIIDFCINDKSVNQTPLTTDAKNVENMVFFPVADL